MSSFGGKWKLSALTIVKRDADFPNAFSELGRVMLISDELFDKLEVFTCRMYGSKNIQDVGELRYTISGEIESHQLPPSRSCLRKYIMLANYQAVIWRKSLIPIMEVHGPEGHGC